MVRSSALHARRALADDTSATTFDGVVAAAATQALDGCGLALLICSPSAVVRFHNEAAGRVGAVAPLRVREGKLVAESDSATRRLHGMILAAGRSGSSQPMSFRSVDGSAEREVAIWPLGGKGGAGDLVAVLVGTPRSLAPPSRAIDPGFTKSELRLLRALAAGERLSHYAARSGVKVTTVKTHLQNLFDKTGERRQCDLVRRAISDPKLRSCVGDIEA